MLLTRKQIKENAKARLSGNWGQAIGTMFIINGINYVASMIVSILSGAGGFNYADMYNMVDYMDSADYFMYMMESMARSMQTTQLLTCVVAIFVSAPLTFGIQRWYYRLMRGFKPEIVDIFYYFTSGKRYGGILAYYFNMAFREAGWSFLVVFVPSILLGIGLVAQSTVLVVVAIIGFMGSLFFLAYIYTRYAITFVQFNDFEGLSSTEAIKRSIEATKPYRKDIFMMRLSFFPQYLLMMASLIIPLFVMIFGIIEENIAAMLIGITLFLVGFIAFTILSYYLTIYMYAAYMELAGNISDTTVGNPYLHQFGQTGGQMQQTYQQPGAPMQNQGYPQQNAPFPPQGYAPQNAPMQNQGYPQQNAPLPPLVPPMPPQGYAPQSAPKPPQSHLTQSAPIAPQEVPVVEEVKPPTLAYGTEAIGIVEEEIELPEIAKDFQGAPELIVEKDLSRPELDRKFAPIEKEKPIYDAEVTEAPQLPQIPNGEENK